MKKTVLEEIISHRAEPCVTIIEPTLMRSFDDKEKIKLNLRNVLSSVERRLADLCDEKKSRKIMMSLTAMADNISFNQMQKGMAMFVSDKYSRLLILPFEVKERVTFNDTFEVRDIIYNLNQLATYFVLLLGKDNCRLFYGSGAELIEISSSGFPMQRDEAFLLKRKRNHFTGYRDESQVNQSALENFFRKVDTAISPFVINAPLILFGVQKEISTYKAIGNHTEQIIGEVKGSFTHHRINGIVDLAWPVMYGYIKNRQEKLLGEVVDAIYNKRAVSGIQEVWSVANQGIGDELVVERDFSCNAFRERNSNVLVMSAETGDKFEEVPDAVEAVIDIMLSHNNINITMVDNDRLKDYGRVILTTKY